MVTMMVVMGTIVVVMVVIMMIVVMIMFIAITMVVDENFAIVWIFSIFSIVSICR